jgi:hypothetical protein
MSINSLSPAFTRITYVSEFAPHIMTLPTTDWIVPTSGHPQGSYTAWDSTTIDANTMVLDLVALFAPLFPASVSFTAYEIFTMATPTSPQLPRAGNVLATVGTDATPGYYEAVQKTITMFDTGFNTTKLTFLDAASHNDFRPRSGSFISAAEQAVIDEFTSVARAWSSRAGLQPVTARKVSLIINEKLRREYHIT